MLKNLILYILTLILCCSLSSNTHNKKSKIIGRWTFVCEINNEEDCEKCLKNISNNKKCTCEEFVLYMYVIEFFHSKKFTISKKNETATGNRRCRLAKPFDKMGTMPAGERLKD